jgi:hypothetical protein
MATDDVQVAQAAGRFLAVGLQRVGRVLVLGWRWRISSAWREEGQRVQLGGKALLELAEQRAAAGDAARLQQGGLHRHVGGGLQRIRPRCARWSRSPARVPALADEGSMRSRSARRGPVAAGQQQQHVDVGVGKQLGAAVAAHGQQRAAPSKPQACHRLRRTSSVRAVRRRRAPSRCGWKGTCCSRLSSACLRWR